MNARAVVFAYHNVGARCLRVLLARGVDVALVVTHQDNPQERIWFESVAAVAADYGLPAITPADPHAPELAEAVRAVQPDFLFSFYYRHMLPDSLLALAPRGAFNLHGSLLPKYRGRVPTNWAVLNGETETGATLHEMTVKPDAGAIVAQTPVPILPDDTASQVFDKVTVAAEQTLWRVLPALLAGDAPRLPNDLAAGSYFGGRRPEDGRIDWSLPAQQVYNLVRAVAPPYPGAFTDVSGERFIVAAARLARHNAASTATLLPGLQVCDNALFGVCGDGRALAIRELRHVGDASDPTHDERVIDAATFLRLTQSSSHS
ncbi:MULTISPECIES: formyltransferase [Burkholderiaceae]|uniref:formyltransferase n=1 Tax=Burkholderiaceae TaxID=119060 RepID=UPI00095F3F6B|nr:MULTISPECIES: formyltransferase [Burkholderiaceae]MCF2133636.1 formyltransferase [Mycetohabitans sp. B3]MCG1039188.1 formyltransferase [Mycetohabitans sp. B7]SIT67746.1 methionyl-tRNA formyltransferase [Burkholderia sp. b14]